MTNYAHFRPHIRIPRYNIVILEFVRPERNEKFKEKRARRKTYRTEEKNVRQKSEKRAVRGGRADRW